MASNTYTLLQVVQRVGFRVGNLKDSIDSLENASPAIENIVECVNESIRLLSKVKGLPMHNARHVFETVDPILYTAIDSISVADPAIVTAVGETFVTDGVTIGMAFKVDADGSEYRITALTETALTLDGAYVGTLPVTTACTIAQDRYALPATFRDVTHAAYDGPASGAMDILTPAEMDRQRYSQRAQSLTTNRPTYFTVYDRDATDNYECQLDPFPDDAYRIVLRTKDMPTRLTTSDAATTMPVDDDNIDVLLRGAEACWQEQTTPGAIRAWFQQYVQFLATFDNKKTDPSPRLVPDDVTRTYGQPSQLPTDTDFLR